MKTWWIFFALFVGTSVYAVEYEFGNFVYAGSGCPRNSADFISNKDLNAIVWHIDPFEVRTASQVIDRKNCELVASVKVSPNYQIGIFPTAYQGHGTIRGAGSIRLSYGKFFVPGGSAPRFLRLKAPFDGKIIADEDKGLVWSPCGRDANFRISLSLMARAPDQESYAQASLEGHHLFRILERKCGLPQQQAQDTQNPNFNKKVP